MPELIRAESLSKQFAQHIAVNAVSFSLAQGSILGLLGPNGAGKTTLIRLITQIILPDSGRLLYKSTPLLDQHRFKMGYLPEERGLYRKMNVKDQLIYFARLRGLSAADAKIQTADWCKRLELEAQENHLLETLSKGQQQKVQFISSVIHKPELLILDEPFSGFDPANSELIKNEIKRLHTEGTTIIYSTHRMDTVEDVCTELILINKAKIVLQGEPEAIRKRFDTGQVKMKYSGIIPSEYQSMILEEKTVSDGTKELLLEASTDRQQMLRSFLDKGIVHEFAEHLPSMHDVFLHTVKEKNI